MEHGWEMQAANTPSWATSLTGEGRGGRAGSFEGTSQKWQSCDLTDRRAVNRLGQLVHSSEGKNSFRKKLLLKALGRSNNTQAKDTWLPSSAPGGLSGTAAGCSLARTGPQKHWRVGRGQAKAWGSSSRLLRPCLGELGHPRGWGPLPALRPIPGVPCSHGNGCFPRPASVSWAAAVLLPLVSFWRYHNPKLNVTGWPRLATHRTGSPLPKEKGLWQR